MLKKIFTYGSLFILSAPVWAAKVGEKFDLSGRMTDIKTEVEQSKGAAETIIVSILFVIGLAFVAWGFYDIFIDEDRQKEGKKVKGSMKVLGGLSWMLLMALVSWLTS